jgi:predicted DNA-binding protein (MmcQ/YjbR family)
VNTRRRIRQLDGDAVLTRVRNLCLSLPETTEAGSWGHPNFRAGRRTFVTYEWIQKRPGIAFHLNRADVAKYAAVRGFIRTPYGRDEWISMKADGRVNWRLTEELILRSYKLVALKRMIQALETRQSASGIHMSLRESTRVRSNNRVWTPPSSKRSSRS